MKVKQNYVITHLFFIKNINNFRALHEDTDI
jgi:hypothetical protein